MTTRTLDASIQPTSIPTPSTPSRITTWVARIAQGMVVLFLIFDASIKLLQLAPAIEGTTELGFAAGAVLPIGVIEACCLALYLVPRTAPIGAVLLTGYLGGAIATHVANQSPLVSHVLFPIYVAVLVWLPLYLRDARVRRFVRAA